MVSKAWILFSESAIRFHSHSGGWRLQDKRLVQLELASKVDGIALPILFSLAIAAIADAILTRISAQKVPSLHRVAPRYIKNILKNHTNVVLKEGGHWSWVR